MTVPITWNGVEAPWEPEEIELAATFALQAEAGEITPAEAKNQVDVIHELKRLGARKIDAG